MWISLLTRKRLLLIAIVFAPIALAGSSWDQTHGYTSRPKATPGDRTDDTHDRIHRDRVDTSGKITLRHAGQLNSIGIRRTHARTRVIVLVQDLYIRILDATTGELLRELTLDTTQRYQGTGRPPGPTR